MIQYVTVSCPPANKATTFAHHCPTLTPLTPLIPLRLARGDSITSGARRGDRPRGDRAVECGHCPAEGIMTYNPTQTDASALPWEPPPSALLVALFSHGTPPPNLFRLKRNWVCRRRLPPLTVGRTTLLRISPRRRRYSVPRTRRASRKTTPQVNARRGRCRHWRRPSPHRGQAASN